MLFLFTGWGMTANEAVAQYGHSYGRHHNRHGISQNAIRDQQIKRAYVAGAVGQYRRERVRDYHEDRYRRDRYYNDHRHDQRNDVNRVLIGVAVGAVVTGAVMSQQNDRR